MTSGKNKPISILFIGNSFSYYHGLPKLIARLARASGSGDLTVEGVFRGGATLKMLWQDGRALKKLRGKTWNYVVLQERGRLGGIVKHGIVHAGNPRPFILYASKFSKEAKRAGAATILYCPPAFIGIGQLEDAKKIHTAYVRLAGKLHAVMIPAGAAFTLALRKSPRINLYERDKHHPNPLGTYLIAALFYRKLFHKKVSGLPMESYSSRAEKLPRKPVSVKLPKNVARFLWAIANQIAAR